MNEALLYSLMKNQAFAKSYFELFNIKKDFCKKHLEELYLQKFSIGEISNFMNGLAHVYPVSESCFDSATKHAKNYVDKETDISIFESALVYLLITGKLNSKNAKKLGYDIEDLNNLLKRYHMNVSLQDPSIKNELSRLFLEFMFVNNFQPENYANILELIQSVPNSLSQYLTNYEQFLLSKQVSYTDLENYKINGAHGYMDKDEGIIVPKSLEADEYFRKKQEKVPDKQIPRYIYPTITDFNSIIFYYDWSKITNLELLKQVITSSFYFQFKNYYIGFIANKDDENLKEKVSIISDILKGINIISSQEHTLAYDTISDINKEFYLIKKR